MKTNLKSKLMLVLILLVGVVILPHTIKAETTYKTLNLKEALAEEEIEEKFTNYKETDDQITVYLFRGKGCGFCRAFLEFMNSITDEYGKYFKMVSYEVWNDSNNSALLNEVSTFLNQPAGGVPYIIIGDKVFPGYASQYDDGIKEAIKELYDTKKKNRYDVFEEMQKSSNNTNASSSLNNSSVWIIIICNIVCTVVACLVTMSHFNNKYNELYEKIDQKKNYKSTETVKSKK